jgi:hypothetical protein
MIPALAMRRINPILLICVGAGGLLMLGAARSPGAMPLASPGLWELTGLPNAGAAARQCLANTAALARLEHRGQKCQETVISQNATTTVIHYTCANGGYGHTRVTMLTPRSLRIETQGISANLPFNYKIQARRVGDCPTH